MNCFPKSGGVQSISGVEMISRRAGGSGVGADSAFGFEEKMNDI